MGRGIVEAQTLRTEQFEFEARTSDPTDAQPGEYWIRADQTSSDPQIIAELRRQDISGVSKIPLFDGSEESNLGSDVVRGPSVVLDGGSVGFIAMTTKSGSVGSPRAVNASGTQYSSHDGLKLSVTRDNPVLLPESDDLTHFDGSTGAYDINSNAPVFGDDQSLKHTGSGDEEIGSSSGLNNYPEVGTPHRFAYYGAESDSDFILYFGYSGTTSANDGYSVRLNYASDNFNVVRRDNASPAVSDDDFSAGLSNETTDEVGVFVEVEILHEADGTLSAELFDADGNSLSSVSITDSKYLTDGSYDSQNIVIRDRTDNNDAFDFWRIV